MTIAPDLRAAHAPPGAAANRVGEAAHDFNNLLGVIIANLDLLADELRSSPRASHLIDEAMAAALRGAELARALLADNRGTAASAPAAPEASAADARFMGRSANGEMVLVVDDNAPLRSAVVQELQALGYRTIEASDGPGALMILNSQPVKLLFTDVVMPGGMSGFDLARLVLARWPAMKALITSAFPELEPTADSIVAGKLRRLIKPYRKDDLALALREVLAA